jgi:hypothetical protein
MRVPLGVQLGWGSILRRTAVETYTDGCFGMAAQLNSEIEHASPYGKAEGEKVPGEHRHWPFRTRRHGGIGEAPEPERRTG